MTVFFILWLWSFKQFTMKWHGSLQVLLLFYAIVKPLCTYLLFLVLCYHSKAQYCFNTKLDGIFVCVFMIYTYTCILEHSWNYFHSGFSPFIFLFAQSFYSFLDDNHSRCFTLLLVSFIYHLLHIYKSSKINKDCTWQKLCSVFVLTFQVYLTNSFPDHLIAHSFLCLSWTFVQGRF
jgi:hypothetical protein